jgi:hypothetical protein
MADTQIKSAERRVQRDAELVADQRERIADLKRRAQPRALQDAEQLLVIFEDVQRRSGHDLARLKAKA